MSDATPEAFVIREASGVVCRLGPGSLQDLVGIEAECNTPPWTAPLFDYEFSHDIGRVWGIRREGVLAGFLVAHLVLDELHVLNFGVRRAMRGNGLGRHLLGAVLREAYDEGARWATLEVRRSNTVAQSLYHSMGFRPTGMRARYYTDDGEDALLLTLNVHEHIGIDRV